MSRVWDWIVPSMTLSRVRVQSDAEPAVTRLRREPQGVISCAGLRFRSSMVTVYAPVLDNVCCIRGDSVSMLPVQRVCSP